MLQEKDKAVWDIIKKEEDRQEYGIELIASENFVSKAVMEAAGSVLTNKYAEGYPGKRYYGGCQFVDEVETLAIERVKEIFGANYANVQAHSGSQANMAVYMALVNAGDKVMGMDLSAGGHLTHGLNINFSGILYNIVSYGVNKETELLDYDEANYGTTWTAAMDVTDLTSTKAIYESLKESKTLYGGAYIKEDETTDTVKSILWIK